MRHIFYLPLCVYLPNHLGMSAASKHKCSISNTHDADILIFQLIPATPFLP